MAAAKAKDDARDTGRPLARLRPHMLSDAYKKAADRRPAVNRDMLEMTAELRGMEARGSGNTDETADTYARLFGNVLMELDVVQSHILYEIGYSMGRWVYLIDAYDDIKQDLEHGEYNVFVNKYGITGSVPAEVKREIEFGFHFTLSKAMQALKRLELKKNRGILENIICLGLKERTKAVMGGRAPAGREPDESIPGVGGQ
jgi:hypothetical protein